MTVSELNKEYCRRGYKVKEEREERSKMAIHVMKDYGGKIKSISGGSPL